MYGIMGREVSGGKMRIGIDIDGVLNYRQEFIMAYGTKFCEERGLGGVKRADAHGIRELFGISKELRDEFWREYAKYQMWIWPAQCFAAEVIRKLREAGHEIFIVTGRNNQDLPVKGMPGGKNWEEITKDWLKENKIEYDAIEFDRGRPAPYDKGTYCAAQKISVMIEDLPEYLETLAGKTKIFVFNQPYNQKVDLPEMKRVYSWYDIYDKIKEME